MKKFLPLLLTLCIGFVGSAEVITKPEGNAVKYFADQQTWDNLFQWMGEYHTEQNIYFSADGETVYIPNMLYRRTMPAYLKGKLDATTKTITVEAGQEVFSFPNEKINVVMRMLDENAKAGASETTPYDNALVFDISDDGIITLRLSEELPMYGICNSTNTQEVYQMGRDLSFTPMSNVEDRMEHFKMEYIYENESTTSQSTGAFYTEGDNVWFKGFNPKYPDKWIKVTKTAVGYSAPSFQVMMYFSDETPIAMAAITDADIPSPLNTLPIDYDKANNTYKACFDNGIIMANIYSDSEQSTSIYQKYHNITITPTVYEATEPAAPVFESYRVSGNETEFVFDSEAKGVDGEDLPMTNLYFKMFVDNKPYTFTQSEYRWMDEEEMNLVPFNYDNYNFFTYSDSRRWVYFQNLPAATKSVGVELVYILNGKEYASKRLTYDIASGTPSTSGIENISDENVVAEEYYDLTGRKVNNPTGGVVIRVSKYADGTTRTSKTIIR